MKWDMRDMSKSKAWKSQLITLLTLDAKSLRNAAGFGGIV